MKSRKMAELVLFVMIMIMPIVSMIMLYHVSVCHTLEKDSPFFMGKESISYYIEGQADKGDVLNAFNEMGIKGALYRMNNFEGNRVIEIFYSGNYVDMPMKNGHFLQHKEIMSEEPLAAVGVKCADRIVYVGKMPYIAINDIMYRVVGIIGMNGETFFDNFIYVNYLADKNDLYDEILEIDYFSTTNGQKFVDNLATKGINAKFAGFGKSVDYSELSNDLKYIKIFVLFLASVGISLFLSLSFYMSSKMKEIAIRRMVGGSIKRVVFQYMFEILKYAIVSFVICFFISVKWFNSFFRYVFKGYLITIPILLALIVIVITKETKKNISEAYY